MALRKDERVHRIERAAAAEGLDKFVNVVIGDRSWTGCLWPGIRDREARPGGARGPEALGSTPF